MHVDPSDYNLNCTFTGIFDIDDCLINFILLEGYCFFHTLHTHTHTCWKWKSTNYHKWLNRTCPCFGTIDFYPLQNSSRLAFFHFATSDGGPYRQLITWWPLPPTPAKCHCRKTPGMVAPQEKQPHHPQMDTSLMRTQKTTKMFRLIKTLDGLAKNSWKLLVKRKEKREVGHSSKLIAQILDSFFKKCKRKD